MAVSGCLDPMVDPYVQGREDRKARIAKNEHRRRANQVRTTLEATGVARSDARAPGSARARPPPHPPRAGPVPKRGRGPDAHAGPIAEHVRASVLAQATADSRTSRAVQRQAGPFALGLPTSAAAVDTPRAVRAKLKAVRRTLDAAHLATASGGRYDHPLPGQPKPPKYRRGFDRQIAPAGAQDRTRSLAIASRILEGQSRVDHAGLKARASRKAADEAGGRIRKGLARRKRTAKGRNSRS